MNLQEIDLLIRKYELGETSLEEETALKSFFSGENIPEEYHMYKELFGFYETALQEELPDPEFDNKFFEKIGEQHPSKSRKLFSIGSPMAWKVAASIVVILGLSIILLFQKKDTGTYDDPMLAYAETKKVLMMVSGNLNTGMEEFSNIKEINTGFDELKNIKSFNDGMKSLDKISVLDKITNIVKQ